MVKSSGGRMEHQCVAGANNIKQPAWRWPPLFIISQYRLEQQQQADSLVVVGAQQHQGGGVLSPCLLQLKARNHEAGRLCTTRSGRSLKLGKEEPKDEGGEGVAKVKV